MSKVAIAFVEDWSIGDIAIRLTGDWFDPGLAIMATLYFVVTTLQGSPSFFSPFAQYKQKDTIWKI
jgi:hypothetical protein